MAVGSLKRSSLTAYAKYDSMLAGNAFTPTTFDYEHLGTVSLTSSQASVTFNLNGYASEYKHLQLRAVVFGSANEFLTLKFNGDTNAANYRSHRLEGNGSTVASGTLSGYAGVELGYAVTAAADRPNVTIMDIIDPFSTTKNKATRALHGSTMIQFEGGLWMSTAAATSLTIGYLGSTTLNNLTRMSLYGIKGTNA